MTDYSQLGDIRELAVAEILMGKGYRISIPFGNHRYDLIAEKYPKYFRIQVKPLNKVNNTVKVEKWKINTQSNKTSYSKNDTDIIFAIDLGTKNFAIIPVECAKGRVTNISTSKRSTRKKYLNSYMALDE